jgi:hypothetical protein
MNYQPSFNNPETLSNNVPYQHLVKNNKNRQRLVGGHVEFSLFDETYEHFFTSPQDLKEIAYYIRIGKPLTGLKNFIANHFAPAHQLNEPIQDENIIIWNYEFDFA